MATSYYSPPGAGSDCYTTEILIVDVFECLHTFKQLLLTVALQSNRSPQEMKIISPMIARTGRAATRRRLQSTSCCASHPQATASPASLSLLSNSSTSAANSRPGCGSSVSLPSPKSQPPTPAAGCQLLLFMSPCCYCQEVVMPLSWARYTVTMSPRPVPAVYPHKGQWATGGEWSQGNKLGSFCLVSDSTINCIITV